MSANTEHIAVVGSFQSVLNDTHKGRVHCSTHKFICSGECFFLALSIARRVCCTFLFGLAVDIRLALTQSMLVIWELACVKCVNEIVALLTTETFKVYSYNRYIVVSHAFFINDAASQSPSPLFYRCRRRRSPLLPKFRIQLPKSNMTVTDVLSPRSKSIRLMHTILLFYCQHYCHIDKFITLFRQQIANAALSLSFGTAWVFEDALSLIFQMPKQTNERTTEQQQ